MPLIGGFVDWYTVDARLLDGLDDGAGTCCAEYGGEEEAKACFGVCYVHLHVDGGRGVFDLWSGEWIREEGFFWWNLCVTKMNTKFLVYMYPVVC